MLPIMKPEHKTAALNRLKTVRGHLDSIIDIMKQLSAVQGSMERVNRILLQNHLETCFTHAVNENRTQEVVDELMEFTRYTKAITGPSEEQR